MKFFEGGVSRLAKSLITKNSPLYVQFYVTARCNLACEQCNIIYTNADQEEATLDECQQIAENLAKIGTSIVLLTGGEPFIRKDLPEIAKAMIDHKIHPRIQTNGLATRKMLERMVEVGAHDISISLDSVVPTMQDKINGGVHNSWRKAIKTIATVNEVFPESSFAAFGCVLAPSNLKHVKSVIKFATKVGWWVSLVPAHVSTQNMPRGFSTFDQRLKFDPSQYSQVKELLEEVKEMRDSGYNLYDSDEYLDDIYRFIVGDPILWRRRNNGVCDSPNLYFAIQPNGNMSVCCDYRLRQQYPVHSPDFPEAYHSQILRDQVKKITSRCSGCMYGSFPEITITARYYKAMISRAKLFLTNGHHRKLERLTAEEMMELAEEIGKEEGLIS